MVQVDRYLLFLYDQEAYGGWGDYVGSFDNIQDCRNSLRVNSDSYDTLIYTEIKPDVKRDYFEIVDLLTMKIVESGEASDYIVQNKPKVPIPPKSAKTGGKKKL